MKHLILTVLALALSACTTPEHTKQLIAAKLQPLDKVIDAHVHTDFSGQAAPGEQLSSREEFLRQMREAKVVGAVSMGARGVPLTEANSLKEYGVVHCVGIKDVVDVKDVEDGLKTGRYGCVKIYLGYVYQWANDPKYQVAYRLAEKYNVPVVFHTGDTYSIKGRLKYSDPLTIDDVAVDFPNVTFVIAHCGNPWWHSAAEVAYKNPNVYLECSAFLIGDLKSKSQETIDELMVKPINWIYRYVENPKKIMFGTDWPLVNISQYEEQFKRAIPPDHWNEVFFENAVRVYKMKPLAQPPTPNTP